MRIFDTFPFDGELDMLEHHLLEVFPLVDVVVLVEAAQTYRGAPKLLEFDRNKDRFAWAASKLRHVKLDGLGPSSISPKDRAAIQRNAIMLGLRDADPGDIVLLLDVDEVPSRAMLEGLRAQGLETPRRIAMTRHYGFADTLGPGSPCCPSMKEPFSTATPWLKPGRWEMLDSRWFGFSGVAAPAAALQLRAPFGLRFGLAHGEPIAGGGRHFSSVDHSTRLQRKLGRVFHAEFDGARETAVDHLERCRRDGVHHRGWWFAERPAGETPEDIARLISRCPETRAPSQNSRLERRLARTWAWLRLWRGLPDGLVASIDRDFERLLPLIAAPLLLCDGGRAVAARLCRCLGLRPSPGKAFHH